MIPAVPIWASLTTLPLEWAALALLTVGAIYWERSALSGIGIEGCVLSAMLNGTGAMRSPRLPGRALRSRSRS